MQPVLVGKNFNSETSTPKVEILLIQTFNIEFEMNPASVSNSILKKNLIFPFFFKLVNFQNFNR